MKILKYNSKTCFDIIGDIHGCYEELCELLDCLGYQFNGVFYESHGRKALFVGDLVDRGPSSPQVVELVMEMVKNHSAFCIPGNHDVKLIKKLSGYPLKVRFGLAESLAQFKTKSQAFIRDFIRFIESLPCYCILDQGKLIVSHAGLPERLHGSESEEALSFSIYGSPHGSFSDEILPRRVPWYNDYRGQALVVFGHTTVLEPKLINNTLDIDTGCVFGGALTALRYPEMDLVSIKAKRIYSDLGHPLVNLNMRN